MSKRHFPDLDTFEDIESIDLVQCKAALEDLVGNLEDLTPRRIQAMLRRHPRADKGLFTRDQLLRVYRYLCETGEMQFHSRLVRHLQRKPTRTVSGVAPVSVLTPPHPCQGECIYCPNHPAAPKSYLPNEPGVQRAIRFEYDPYAQTAGRIQAFENIGHPTDKIELLILGGSWADYPDEFQEQFILRCFDAMNGTSADSLESAHRLNETAPHRNVGLAVETRPDHIVKGSIRRLRQLGATKVQMGVQSLDDRILALNRRGHTVATTRAAIRRLRLAGFKIVAHWMPNLLGSTPESDLVDFKQLWEDPALRPDELKIYPCLLVEGTELHSLWLKREYEPYDEETMVDLLADCKTLIPPYCRVNRLMRDIPAPDIVGSINKSNLRQIIQRQMAQKGSVCRCIRCREIRDSPIDLGALQLTVHSYDTDVTQEHFLTWETGEGNIAGLLRLSLPQIAPEMAELAGCAMVRELHIYGPALQLGKRGDGSAQHSGLGTRLLSEARRIAVESGYRHLAVIAAVGTRPYYRERGFELVKTFMMAQVSEEPLDGGEL
jgi:elongator complex protein 3